MLAKPTQQAPHGGGKKMEPNGEEYKIVRRWIASSNCCCVPAAAGETALNSDIVLTSGAGNRAIGHC